MKLNNRSNNETVDGLKRKKTAENYVDFINTLKGKHTIALDAPWGSGKTTFIEFMCEKLMERDDLYITYNAWENDYTDDPFLSLISNIFEQITDKKYIKEDKLQSVKNTAWAASKVIGKGLIKGAGKALIGSDAAKELSDNIEEIAKGVISEGSNELANKVFKDINLSKKTREQFTVKLKEVSKTIIKEKGKEKIIIIIDELDRCKPTFAINLLENIKHLFDIEEIIFFIATDRKQLAESIRAIYGANFDANTYLDRFFDVDLQLSQKEIVSHFENKVIEIFNEDLWNELRHDNIIHDAILLLMLTIRDFEQVLYKTLLLKTINTDYIIKTSLCIILLILKKKLPNFYKRFKNNHSDYFKAETLKKDIETENLGESHFTFISTIILRHMTYKATGGSYYHDYLEDTMNIIESTQ